MRNPHTATKSSPPSPQLEKARVQQWKSNTAINKEIKEKRKERKKGRKTSNSKSRGLSQMLMDQRYDVMALDPGVRQFSFWSWCCQLLIVNPSVNSDPFSGSWLLSSSKEKQQYVSDIQKALNTYLLSEWTQQKTRWNNLSVLPDISVQVSISSFHAFYSQMQVNRMMAGIMFPLDLKKVCVMENI